ncbi:NAD(P)H-dependent oxidoreductase [Altererythrobacter sp. Z27]|uniref:NAD(P)H-dependent oxidoreductase n=1 Tax=Altererythrobacter sp. Z27 TaxID=3461147 RepID=UPI004043D721
MIIVDRILEQRARQGKDIRVGLVGAGFQGRGIAQQIIDHVPGMRLAAIANRTLPKAIECYRQCGIEPVIANDATSLSAAISDNRPAVTEDALALASCGMLDAIIEVTGSIEHAAGVVLRAIESGIHVVQMNAELDGTVGPILKAKADKAGVVYTFCDGDQPGVQGNLLRFVTGLGVTPVLSGNIKGLHDPYRNPETQKAFAAKWGQNAAMVSSFADGTKISFEQAIVANAYGYRVVRRGMLGPDFSGGDPNSPLVPIEEAIAPFIEHLDPTRPALVDYVVGAKPGPGVFVIGTTPDPQQRHYLNLYKLGEGPYYVFSTPYHLCHFEVPFSVARAVLLGDATLTPRAEAKVGVFAVAKTDLGVGTRISEFGGFEAYGVAENIEVMRRDRLLPIGIALDCRLKVAVAKDTPLTFDMVDVPEGRVIDRLYAEQEELFFGVNSADQIEVDA